MRSGDVVGRLLASGEAVAVGTGPDLIARHNHAFEAAIGGVGQAADGVASLREVCAEFWPRLAPLVERVVRFGERAVLEDQLVCRFRNGYAEEAYLRFACGPLVVSDGTIGGVVVTLADRTDRVIAERRTAALREIAAAGGGSCSVRDACTRIMAAMSRHPGDVPFAMVYVRGDSGRFEVAASAGASAGSEAWPVAEAVERGEAVIVDDVVQRFGVLPAGGWPFAPRSAVVVPLTASDGALICGVSARHGLDGAYLGFIDLVAAQVAAAMAGGRARENEERAVRVRRAELRALRARFDGVLEERTRLAREIHDTLLQGATGIALQLRAVLPDVCRAPDASAAVIRRIVELAERTSAEARQAVWDMRLAPRGKRDLVRALEMGARRIIATRAIQLRVGVVGEERRLDAAQQAAATRIVQEATANAVRHASPRRIHLRVKFGRRGVRIAIVDDGRGFLVPPDFRVYEGHWGLVGMQERARGLGGELAVRSVVGRGTAVVVRVPYGVARGRRLQAVG